MRKTIVAILMSLTAMAASAAELDNLAAGQALHGFRVASVYLNDFDKPMGA